MVFNGPNDAVYDDFEVLMLLKQAYKYCYEKLSTLRYLGGCKTLQNAQTHRN